MDEKPVVQLSPESREVVHKARDQAQAVEVARQVQAEELAAEAIRQKQIDEQKMTSIIEARMQKTEVKLLENVTDTMKAAFKFAFTTPEGQQRKFIDVTQLSRVCDDIKDLKEGMVTKSDFLLMKQQSDLTNKIVFYAVGFICTAFLSALVTLVYKS